MRTRTATALSLVGVLAAGSAAALANTQILTPGETASGASAAVLPEPTAVELTIPRRSDAAPDQSAAPTTAATRRGAATSTTRPPTSPAPASEFLTTFNVGDAGAVTVDVIRGELRLVEADPGAGWSLADAREDADEDEVHVKFRAASTAVEFEAALVDGVIVPHVDSRSLARGSAATTQTGPPAAPAAGGSDDEDEEDDDDEDEDEEDEEDEEYQEHEDEEYQEDEDEEHDEHEEERDDD